MIVFTVPPAVYWYPRSFARHLLSNFSHMSTVCSTACRLPVCPSVRAWAPITIPPVCLPTLAGRRYINLYILFIVWTSALVSRLTPLRHSAVLRRLFDSCRRVYHGAPSVITVRSPHPLRPCGVGGDQSLMIIAMPHAALVNCPPVPTTHRISYPFSCLCIWRLNSIIVSLICLDHMPLYGTRCTVLPRYLPRYHCTRLLLVGLWLHHLLSFMIYDTCVCHQPITVSLGKTKFNHHHLLLFAYWSECYDYLHLSHLFLLAQCNPILPQSTLCV